MSRVDGRASASADSVALKRQELYLVVAMTKNYIIGVANQLPWRLSADLKRFRNLTLDHPVVMGRKTFESIGRALPQRRNIVVTRGGWTVPQDIETAASLPAALALCAGQGPIFVIGGGELYREALPVASRIYLTFIELRETNLPLFKPFEGDAYFPEIDPREWAIDRLGRRNVARPKGKPAPIELRTAFFRFVDLVRRRHANWPTGSLSDKGTFDLEKFARTRNSLDKSVPISVANL